MTIQSGSASDLFCDINGPENAPLIVFAHALGGNLTMWDRQVIKLAKSYRLLRYDLRGHGGSPQPSGSLTLEDLAHDVLGLLDQYKVQRAHFCGLSLGGLIGQWLGLHAQDRLRSLTIVDSAPRMGSAETWNERISQIEHSGMSVIAESTMNRWFTEQFREKEPATVSHLKSILEATSPTGYIACAKVVRDASQGGVHLKEYASIKVPTLVVTGKFDSAATPEASKAMASLIPGSQYVELPAAHISPVETSEAFTQALETFQHDQQN